MQNDSGTLTLHCPKTDPPRAGFVFGAPSLGFAYQLIRWHHASMIDKTLPTPPADGKKPGSGVDWDSVERDYRIGIKPLRQIAVANGITEGAIRKRAKRDDWTRDLSVRIKEKADQLVRKAEVRAEYAPTERVLVEANAEAIVSVRLEHRKDIKRSRLLSMRLLEELEGQTHGIENFTELGELLRSPDDRGMDKLNEMYQKVISLPGRTKTMKDLGDTLKTLVGLERQAFSIDDGTPPDDVGASRQFIVTYRTSPHAG